MGRRALANFRRAGIAVGDSVRLGWHRRLALLAPTHVNRGSARSRKVPRSGMGSYLRCVFRARQYRRPRTAIGIVGLALLGSLATGDPCSPGRGSIQIVATVRRRAFDDLI